MRINATDTLWAVRDPGPESELGDILWETTLGHLCNYLRGYPKEAGPDTENLTLFSDYGEARLDAIKRMGVRVSEREEDALGPMVPGMEM